MSVCIFKSYEHNCQVPVGVVNMQLMQIIDLKFSKNLCTDRSFPFFQGFAIINKCNNDGRSSLWHSVY